MAEVREVLEDSECDCHDSHLAALDRIVARLSEAEAALPDAFYAHLLLPDRIRLMAAGWSKAIDVANDLEARLSKAEQEISRYRASLMAHHEISTLSDAAIRESIGGTCQICARAHA